MLLIYFHKGHCEPLHLPNHLQDRIHKNKNISIYFHKTIQVLAEFCCRVRESLEAPKGNRIFDDRLDEKKVVLPIANLEKL